MDVIAAQLVHLHGAVGDVVRHRGQLVILQLTLVGQGGLRRGEAREGGFLEFTVGVLCKTAGLGVLF